MTPDTPGQLLMNNRARHKGKYVIQKEFYISLTLRNNKGCFQPELHHHLPNAQGMQEGNLR